MVLFPLFLLIDHGNSEVPHFFVVTMKLCAMFKKVNLDAGDCLHEYLLEIGRLPSFPEMLRGSYYTSRKYLSFHVRTLQENQQETGDDPKERERLRLAWGKRYQSKVTYIVGRN